MHLYAHAHTDIYTNKFTHIYTRTYNTLTRTQTHTDTLIHIYSLMHINIHTFLCTLINNFNYVHNTRFYCGCSYTLKYIISVYLKHTLNKSVLAVIILNTNRYYTYITEVIDLSKQLFPACMHIVMYALSCMHVVMYALSCMHVVMQVNNNSK